MIPPRAERQRQTATAEQGFLYLAPAILVAILVLLVGGAWLSMRYPEYNRSIAWVQLTLGGSGIALALLFLGTLRRALFEPFTRLGNWAKRVRNGDLTARVPVPASGEFSELAADINGIGATLQSLSQDMDSQVRKQTEHLAQKTRSLQVLYDVAASLNASRDLNDLLTRFLYTMRDIVNAKAGTVRMLTDNNHMEMVASIGLDDDVVERERLVPVQRCLCGSAVAEGEVLFQTDLNRCGHFVGRPMLSGDDLEMIAVPLQYRGQNLGVYNLFVEKSTLESRDDLKALFTSIGRHLGMAIEKARLDNESKRLSIIQERNALAHELHDSLAQTLASLRFQVSLLNETIDKQGKDAAKEEIQQIKGGLDEAYTELRELLAHFRAPMDTRGLLPALEDLASNLRKQTGMHVFLQTDWDSTRLSGIKEMQVFRILQEALANIRKHSKAQNVRVMLRSDQTDNYRVLVEDDGVGLRKPAFSGHPGEHLGLSIMQERARHLGGELRIESEPGEGTRVLLTFTGSSKPDTDKKSQPFTLL